MRRRTTSVSTVSRKKPLKGRVAPKPARAVRAPSAPPVRPSLRANRPPPPAPQVAQIVDEDDRTLVDVLDGLLNQGVVLDAHVVLALANVDLVYLRLSALLCAADRVLPRVRR